MVRHPYMAPGCIGRPREPRVGASTGYINSSVIAVMISPPAAATAKSKTPKVTHPSAMSPSMLDASLILFIQPLPRISKTVGISFPWIPLSASNDLSTYLFGYGGQFLGAGCDSHGSLWGILSTYFVDYDRSAKSNDEHQQKPGD